MNEYVGRQIGNYQLLHLLGHGGFADVYLGEHIYLKKQVAIKLLQLSLDGGYQEEFLNEARTVASLKHPNIVRVLDFGAQNDIPYLVMSYAPNGTLRQCYPHGTILPLGLIITFTQQIAEGLQYAHHLRVIHRDIKPENMLLANNNKVLLSDFGIASVIQNTHIQNIGAIVGTVAYMAPEQLQGKPNPASDQYSLGIVVYEWLCGRRPFSGGFTEMCTQQMLTDPPSLREKVASISPAVEEVVRRALAKDSSQRFPSVRAFAQALEQASLQLVISPSTIPLPASDLAATTSMNNAQIADPLPQATVTASSPASTPAQTPQTKPAAHQRRISRRMALAGLCGLLATGGGFSLWQILRQNSHQPVQNSHQPVQSHIGTLIYVYRGHRDYITALAWAPNARRIASASADQTVQVWDALTGRNAFTYTGHSDIVDAVTWSADGWCIASGSYDRTAQVWDADNGQYMLTYKGHSGGITAIDWAPGSSHIASGSFDKTVHIWDAFSGHTYQRYRGHTGAIYAIAWSPDGQYISSASADHTVHIWKAQTGQTILVYRQHTNTVATVAWSPDGMRIVSGGYDKTVQVWDARTGAPLFTFHGHPDYVNAVAWSPDSKGVASGSGDTTVQEWDVTTGKHIYTYHGHSTYVNAVAWNPSAQFIASGGTDSVVQVWRATDG